MIQRGTEIAGKRLRRSHQSASVEDASERRMADGDDRAGDLSVCRVRRRVAAQGIEN